MKNLILALIIMATAGIAQAGEKQKLGNFITSEYNNQIEALNTVESSEATMTQDGWYLNKVRVRVRATIGLEVPYLAKFEIKPFLGIHLKRKNPVGYTSYKPATK